MIIVYVNNEYKMDCMPMVQYTCRCLSSLIGPILGMHNCIYCVICQSAEHTYNFFMKTFISN